MTRSSDLLAKLVPGMGHAVFVVAAAGVLHVDDQSGTWAGVPRSAGPGARVLVAFHTGGVVLGLVSILRE